MLIRLTENLHSKQFGSIPAGCILHFPDAIAIELLNSGAAEAVRTSPKEIALAP